jgi:catechol-2,3-dioxygenase|tara:strand:+ start:1301 stop:2167 length:867 start_codon:yes stop_codon:yes gene_type:complete
MNKVNFNRATVDVGNILAMEHVNVTVPDQPLATLFYVNVLGFTRDPYMDFGPSNVWVNVGRQQFHLPTADAQVLRGHVGVVVPDLKSLLVRLQKIGKKLKGTQFTFTERKNHLDITCPWGNHIRCFSPGSFGKSQLGIPYIEFHVPADAAPGISRFYEQVMGCRTNLNKTKKQCEVLIGKEQFIRFKETRKPTAFYDGHHIAVYVANFSGPHRYLQDNNLITEESDQNQYRFQTIVDPNNGTALFDIEHEVRSLHHPMYERHLINRNAEQGFFNYQDGRDAFTPQKVL